MSKFEFLNPHMTNTTFQINADFSDRIEEIEMPIQIRVNRMMIELLPEAEVEVEVEIGKKSNEYPFSATLAYAARFRWAEEAFTEDQVDVLLTKNATALLLAYARPAIACITGFSKYPAYSLPFIDLTKED